MTDPRITAAREFLSHARTGPKPAALPRIVIDREDAELRRQLGNVLDVVGTQREAASILDDVIGLLTWLRGILESDTLRQALMDAIDFRADVAGSQCKDCDAHPAGLCEDHTTDVVLFEAYRQLAADLGIEVGPS
jgi:hypothetical protein